jgi:hypothetical protein
VVDRKVKVVKREAPYHGYTKTRVRNIKVGAGLPPLSELQEELDHYMDVLMGREDAPVNGILALMETADIFYARASEIDALIKRGEADGSISRGSDYPKFRTGELRTFRELASKAAELGSRRLTALVTELEQSKLGRESAGGV